MKRTIDYWLIILRKIYKLYKKISNKIKHNENNNNNLKYNAPIN